MGHGTVLKARTAPEGELLGLAFFHGRHAELVLARRDSNDLTGGSALQDCYDSSGHLQYLAAVAGIAESD